MDIIIQSLGFKASDNLENFIHEKLNKVVLESDNVIRANVTLYIGSESNPENNVCEIRLEVPGNDHFVKKSSDVFEKAITGCIDALQKIIRKTRDKQISSRHIETKLPE
jgi:ribosome-associated translation inhibitor RaiA